MECIWVRYTVSTDNVKRDMNKYKMLHPCTVAEKIAEIIYNENKYKNGIAVDLPR